MEMPNTNPQTLTQELLEEKYRLGSEKSIANYSFYMGASNDNLDEILKTDPQHVCGLKVFMGASTGNMLVDNPETLENIFSQVKFLIATHCEDEPTIQANMAHFRELYGEDVPVMAHPLIRSEEACYRSSTLAVQLARKYNSRLHVLHLSTANEMALFSNELPLKEKRITAEVCVHHLWFSENDYPVLGNRIKWNPSIKSAHDRESLWKALLEDKIDIIATDHAPHTLEEKQRAYPNTPSGMPGVETSLPLMLTAMQEGRCTLAEIQKWTCAGPAEAYRIPNKGKILEGWDADLTLVDIEHTRPVRNEETFTKVHWSPWNGRELCGWPLYTIVNGEIAFDNGHIREQVRGRRLTYLP
jgi:dihydroorotase